MKIFEAAPPRKGLPPGVKYGKMELTHPTRVVTSTVKCEGGPYPRCPVKTDRAVPKELMFRVMEALEGITLTAPVAVGQVVVENVFGTGTNVIATRDMPLV